MFSQSYYPSRYTQPSPRDKYLAALAQAKAAEEEFLAAGAIEQEEHFLRRRLEELQLQRQQVSLPSYGAPDRLALLRLQLQQEEQAQAELLRQREEETALAALQERRQRAQLQLLLEQRRKKQDQHILLNSLRSQAPRQTPSYPRACMIPKLKKPAVRNERPQASPTIEEILQHFLEPQASSRTPEPERRPIPPSVDATQSHTTAIEQALNAIFPHISLRQPQRTPVEVQSASSTTSAPARPAENFEKSAPPAPAVSSNASSADNAGSLEQILKSLFGYSVQIKASTPNGPSSVPSSSQAISEPKKKPSVSPLASSSTPAPTLKTEPATGPFSSTDAAAGLEQILKSLFGDAVTVKAFAPSEGASSQPTSTPQAKPAAPHPVPRRPKSPASSLKEQLEARLASDESTEIKDTIQAIFNSLSDADSLAPAPSTTTSTSDTSSSKGKAKVEPTPSTTDATSSDLATSLATVNRIETAYRSLIDEFTFPDHLDFTPISSPASSDTEQSLTSRLAYTARNAPLRYYEQALSGLLAELDSVESFGHEELRAKRKEVVGLVEGALEDLEREVEGRLRVKDAKEREAVQESVLTEGSRMPSEVAATPVVATTPAEAVAAATPADFVDSSTPSPNVDTSVPVIEEEAHHDSSSETSASLFVDEPTIEEPEEALEDSIIIEDNTSDLADSEEPDNEEGAAPYLLEPTAPVDTVKLNDEALSLEKKVVDDAGSDWSEVEA
ncbi:hypothetical protein BDZ89DRAFT_1077944 [Hymenopellis radicata]|nr:hypothetical protein BDZ89DRAFT_1077944 [Hymenopellis radicata]